MIYKFGIFEFDDETRELRKNGRAAALEPQPAKALALLLSRAGDVISRDELRVAVWGKETHVDFERGIAYCLSQIRTALGDSGDNPRFIQTIPKRGFKFIAPLDQGSRGFKSSSGSKGSSGSRGMVLLGAGLVVLIAAAVAWLTLPRNDRSDQVLIAVSIFDNETGNAQYDRPVAGLSDLVVERLTKLDPRIAVIGNAAILRQPRNLRNLKAVAENVKADYVLLGQLQQGESGLRFITHFIRLRDEAHLKANRLTGIDPTLAGLETAVVQEFDHAVREHVLR